MKPLELARRDPSGYITDGVDRMASDGRSGFASQRKSELRIVLAEDALADEGVTLVRPDVAFNQLMTALSLQGYSNPTGW